MASIMQEGAGGEHPDDAIFYHRERGRCPERLIIAQRVPLEQLLCLLSYILCLCNANLGVALRLQPREAIPQRRLDALSLGALSLGASPVALPLQLRVVLCCCRPTRLWTTRPPVGRAAH